ncbi:MAG: Fpg/Nei family DNA glycosylase, partial [Candidatus Hodarchaeota archaeon]
QGKQKEFEQFNQKKISDIVRLGKFLIWRFKNLEAVILNHLGMTGKWCFVMKIDDLKPSIKHPKVIIEMDNPPHAIFDDIRNFGQYKIFLSFNDVKEYPPIRSLGIDGLIEPFPIELFLEKLSLERYAEIEIGKVLINQRLVAGIGNIYKTESLFLAGIHPLRIVKSLSNTEKKKLGFSIVEILQKALNDKGSTFGTQPYSRPSGETGDAQRWHNVYGRKGESCIICGTTIERIVQKDRSTFFCPGCQK